VWSEAGLSVFVGIHTAPVTGFSGLDDGEMLGGRSDGHPGPSEFFSGFSKSELDLRRTDNSFPVAWIKNYDTRRMFYGALGHTSVSWELRPPRRCT
jgi:hypothetical protein